MNDQEFLAFVKQHSDLGYGRMMQIISYAWYEYLKREHCGLERGAFTVMCVDSLSEEKKQVYLDILQSYKDEGMVF
jgi:hypothetical protein